MALATLLVSANAHAAQEPTPTTQDVACIVRQTFVVEPFANLEDASILAHLEAGLPALIAERLAMHPPLRFVGPPTLISAVDAVPADATPLPPRLRVTGRFEPLVGLRLRVTVEIVEKGTIVGRADRSGRRDEAAQLALQAAWSAFDSVPELKMAPPEAGTFVALGRDPYAFTLYARGLSRLLGVGGQRPDAGDAAVLLSRSLVIDPRVPETRRLVGLLHMLDGRPGHARTNWLQAEDARPDNVMLIEGLARLDRSEGQASAEERFARLLRLDPDNTGARRVHGEMLYERGDLDGAQKDLEMVLAGEPTDMRARRTLTLVLSARQAGPDLVQALETVVKLDPDDMDARMDLAAAYLNEGRMNDAASVYDQVLKQNPRSTGALKMAADLAVRREQWDQAVGHYLKLRRISPGDPRPVFLLGAAYHRTGNTRAAERMFEEGAALPGMRPDAFANLGAIMLETGRAREARWFLDRAVRWRPGEAGFRYNYALALRAMDQHAEALNELRVAIAADPGDAELHHAAGVVALRLGLLHEAQKEFRAAVMLNPEHRAARHNLGLLEGVDAPLGESTSLINIAP